MKAVKVSDLKVGMRFSKPVYIEGENLLVPAELPIKQKDLDRLQRWTITEVFTDGKPISEDAETGKRMKESPLWAVPREEKYLKVYFSAIERVEKLFSEVAAGVAVSHDAIDMVVSDLWEAIRQDKNAMIRTVLQGGWGQRKLSSSAVNCTIIASVIASSMKLTSHRLLQTSTGALLHDLGMLKISGEILQKEAKLTSEELNQIHTHPILSYQVISKELKYPEEIAAIALQHHEHWDGKGYPRRLKGEDIQLSARIVAVADAYEAMIGERPYRDSMIGYSAMKNILSDNGKHFDPKVLKAFLESVGVFPVGSIVQLNNSSIGRIVENHTEAPLRPKLELLIDEYGSKIRETELVDLLNQKNLFIVKAVDPKLIGETSR